MPNQRWTIEQLTEAISESSKWKDVCSKLNLKSNGNINKKLRNIASKYNIDYSHFKWGKKYSQEELVEALPQCRSIRQLLLMLGMNETGSAHFSIKQQIKELGLDISHFTGQSWNKGNKDNPTHPSKSLYEILVENSSASNSNLKKRLLKENILENICSICGQEPIWNNLPLTLQLDHINGIRSDNRIENLRILCPHCHSQTETFCSRNCNNISTPGKEYTTYTKKCVYCEREFTKKYNHYKFCSQLCRQKSQRKVERPNKDQLQKEIKDLSWCAIGRKYGVSDNAVRKWAKSYDII